MPQYWLMKSEPDTFSIDDLERLGSTPWDGVRNYQARNYMQSMKVGDLVLFYHSNADPPGVAGIAQVTKKAHPDVTAQDPKSKYYDPKATPDNPRWFCVEVSFVEKLPRLIPLGELKTIKGLGTMIVVKKGSRLSVTPVTAKEWKALAKVYRG